MNVRYIVELTDEERKQIVDLTRGGVVGARKMIRAQILMMSDKGEADCTISRALPTSTSTIYRTKRRYVEGGLDRALNDKQRPGSRRKLNGFQEAYLIALACCDAPEGRARWTCQLLADELVRLELVDDLSSETVRRRLKDNKLKPWQRKAWCVPKVDAEFVYHMEDVLDLYAEPPDSRYPVVSFDETPTQLIGETRIAFPMEPGHPQRYDYEYRRHGTANLFVFYDINSGWRHVKVTDSRTKADFAECMRELVDKHRPNAERIRVVLDNLNTHKLSTLYEAFEPDEARRIVQKLEFHYTPKHGSWLNMVEIEIGVLGRQCLNRRIPTKDELRREIAAWQKARNAQKARIKWMFSVDDARAKLGRVYPS